MAEVDAGPMPHWKLLLPLALLVPLLAYVVGTLASTAHGPSQPAPVILDVTKGEDRAADPAPVNGSDRDNGSEKDDDEQESGIEDDDAPLVITPKPTQLEDEAADDDDDDDQLDSDTGERRSDDDTDAGGD